MNIAFPFQISSSGRTVQTGDNDHVLQMIEQLLFTNPGERVNRPDFGTGVKQLVFAGNTPQLADALQMTLHADLQRFMGDLIDLATVEASAEDSTLAVDVQYSVRVAGELTSATLRSGG